MKKPKLPAFDELESMLHDMYEMEIAIKEIKSRIKEIPLVLASRVSSEEEKANVARYLYWMVQEIPATRIAEDLLGINVYEMKEIVASSQSSISCDRCSNLLEFRSRSHLKDTLTAIKKWESKEQSRYAEGYVVLCDNCWSEVQNERTRSYEIQERSRKARLQELQSMKYYEYLQTPEWQSRRREHLKSAGYRCQVCNAKDQILDVHHRTYERRGQEYYKDLIALCRSCHTLFHEQGKLANK